MRNERDLKSGKDKRRTGEEGRKGGEKGRYEKKRPKNNEDEDSIEFNGDKLCRVDNINNNHRANQADDWGNRRREKQQRQQQRNTTVRLLDDNEDVQLGRLFIV